MIECRGWTDKLILIKRSVWNTNSMYACVFDLWPNILAYLPFHILCIGKSDHWIQTFINRLDSEIIRHCRYNFSNSVLNSFSLFPNIVYKYICARLRLQHHVHLYSYISAHLLTFIYNMQNNACLFNKWFGKQDMYRMCISVYVCVFNLLSIARIYIYTYIHPMHPYMHFTNLPCFIYRIRKSINKNCTYRSV